MLHEPRQFTQRAIDIIVDGQLAVACREGVFDALPNVGKPDPLFDEPYDPNWWIRSKLMREGMRGG